MLICLAGFSSGCNAAPAICFKPNAPGKSARVATSGNGEAKQHTGGLATHRVNGDSPGVYACKVVTFSHGGIVIAIRWLGAFGKGASLEDSLAWELSAADREVAAEWFGDDIPVSGSGINHCQVGLLLARGTIRRHYNGDVWSVSHGPYLRATRAPYESMGHTECFCIPRYRGIVVRCPLDQLSPKVRRPVMAAARRHGLPVYVIDRKGGNFGRLKKVNS